ncbi:hypothetical protein JOF48_000117 [Arthrobacter stackebrandtii]|uniref:HTH marR-type domain-containing protein n=1 Tax=Arthrobacter stackebrandtii TaxID=272161 RepID=A0ABS4YR91_9MICC|nr:helix-turn-helix domain-containing protein [Arthrobacter stackebrandtii]MBP2411318.1 hypothetical protein [Arthrobacter stackebrandtii]PYH00145.1 MarR family transcriptional regulator [Arthrobacter stackebrandtii]
MFVLTIDQRGSRRHGDKVPELLAALAGVDTVLPFERSVGDEVQAALVDPGAVVEAAMRVLRLKDWYVGVGVGLAELPLPASSREASGSAFVAAREAVEAAKKAGDRVPLRVRTGDAAGSADARGQAGAGGGPGVWAAASEAVLVLVGDVVRSRSEAEWRVLDALDAAPGAAQKDIAAQLGITPQAVSRAIRRSGRHEERNGRRAAELLLSQIVGGGR